MFKWFDASEAVSLGKSIANEIALAYPANPPQKTNKKKQEKSHNRLIKTFDDGATAVKAKDFNVYKKAKFLSTFKQCLLDHGYSQEWADKAIKTIMTR